jgi:hypothetical protein
MSPQVVVIAGRTVKNYRQCGESIPRSFLILRCAACSAKVAISPDGAALLAHHSASDPIVLCIDCALRGVPEYAELAMTRNAADQLDRSEASKPALDEFLRKFQKEPQ